MNEKLVFVYNAGSDLFSTITGFAHEILSPSTYQCHLCALTYENFSIKQEWKSFTKSLPVHSVLLYKHEFEKQYSMPTALPAVFISANGALQELVTKQEIESCKNVGELKRMSTTNQSI